MKMSIVLRIAALLCALAPLACRYGNLGAIYTDVGTYLDTDMDATRVCDKSGEASSYSILWLVAWGDAGIHAAACNGGLKVIHSADQRAFSILSGVYLRTTTVVYGE